MATFASAETFDGALRSPAKSLKETNDFALLRIG